MASRFDLEQNTAFCSDIALQSKIWTLSDMSLNPGQQDGVSLPSYGRKNPTFL